MPDWSRRRVLQALGTAATVAVAGCSSGSDGFEETAAADRGEPVTDYALRTVRDSAGEQLFWRGERPDPDERTGSRAYVTSADDVEELTFVSDSEAADELASFVRATDYESGTESVLVQTTLLRACRKLRFRGVRRESDGGLHTSFCEDWRPADVACGKDERHAVGVAVRLPFGGEESGGHGSRWSGQCDRRPSAVSPGSDAEKEGETS